VPGPAPIDLTTLISLTDTEIAMVVAYGTDLLTGLFEQEPDLLDVSRTSAFDNRSNPAED